MRRTLICVSHCDGAGGDEVARLVADQLGLRYVDEEIISAAAKRAGAAPQLVADAEQRQPLLRRVLDELGATGAAATVAAGGFPLVPNESPPPRGDQLRRFIADAIEAVAAQGHVVIGAHGASFTLGPRDDLLRVFVTAPAASRARRVARQRGIEATEAEHRVREADKTRADYLRRFYDVDREAPTQYDLVVNTDVLSPHEAASIVVRAAG
jgi:cytidylate kinase